MKYNDIKIKPYKKTNRAGRGIAAGQGKTAGRGTKGYGSRTGSKDKPGFAGGSNPLMQQLPKLPGFRSFKTKAEVIYTGQLDQFAGKIVGAELLSSAKLISNAYVAVKLITKGEVTKKVTVKLSAASQSAVEAVQKAGGSFEPVKRLARAKTSTKTTK
jgi:large subunit ribosomal protein L15